MHAITLKIFILKLNIENIIKYESYYFLRVLTFLQLYFARGPLIGPWVLLVWGRDCPPKCWLVAWIATQPIGRSGSRARHGGPFLVSHWLLSLPRQLAVAKEFRPNGVPRLLLMTVPSCMLMGIFYIYSQWFHTILIICVYDNINRRVATKTVHERFKIGIIFAK